MSSTRLSLRKRRGFSLIEVLFGMFLLAAAGIVFASLYPLGTKMAASARYRGQAIRLARGEMESLRRVALDKGKFDYISGKNVAGLTIEGVVDSSATAASLSFTDVVLIGDGTKESETVGKTLPSGVGKWTVTADSPTTDLTLLKVTVSWSDPFGNRAVDVYGVVTKYMK